MKKTVYHLEQLAHLVQGEPIGSLDLDIIGLASLDSAEPNQITFVTEAKYLPQAQASKAGAFIVTEALKEQLSQHKNFIVVKQPYAAFAQLTHVFEKKHSRVGIESTAQIASSAIVSDSAYIGHYVVIGENSVIGEHSVIQSHAVIGDDVLVGKNCFIDCHVSLLDGVQLKNHVRIHANTVIGSEGFGFAPHEGKWHRIVQLGSVKIGNNVRIGSNCSIDRGALDDTIIADGVIIDNLVQVAHNVQIGENTAIAAKTGIAGSTVIGKNCILGGDVGVVGHLKITDNVTLTAMSMVTKNILQPGTYSSGTGIFEHTHWKKSIVKLRQLADVPLTQILKRIDHMQTQIESLESTFKMRK